MKTIELTNDQLKCKTDILHTLLDSSEKYHTLIGAAGTGKTTLISDIIHSIPWGKTICVATPTHKATKVARKMGHKEGIYNRCDYATIHSVLAIKPVRVDGDEVYIKDKWAEEKEYDILIIDESSMLGEDLITYIMECASKKVIFIGDSYQIKPVNAPDGVISEVFTEVDIVSKLLKIVRHDNPIINLATRIRNSQDSGGRLGNISTELDENGDGILRVNNREWFRLALEDIKSDKFKEDSDYCRIVAYTNKVVDRINSNIRTKLFGVNIAEYLKGEIIVAQEAKIGEFNNADEFTVESVEEWYDEVHHLDCYTLKIVSLEDDTDRFVDVVAESSLLSFENKLDKIKQRAYNEPDLKKIHWREFWALNDKFIKFKHIYCCTAHKSQGSTFEKTYVFLPDFLSYDKKCENLETKQLLYTAITRSSKLTSVN